MPDRNQIVARAKAQSRSMFFEEAMVMAYAPSDEFDRPVVVLTTFGHPAAISSAMEAYMFLADWPPSKRDAAHAFTAKACLRAVQGDIEIETARGLFASWCERQDILAPDVAAFTASRTTGPRGTA